jgi:tRNA pseudouridine55 synthase
MNQFINAKNFLEGSLLLVDKPMHWTSFDVVNKIRYALKKFYPKIKVGHAGTLDPLATGLLIVCTGKLTKQIDSIQTQDKTYTGTLFLGATTPSYDLETAVDATFETAHITPELIHEKVNSFLGEQQQMPPIFSAIKKDGKAAYISARQGEEIKMDARKVHINDFKVSNLKNLENMNFEVSCSKGTYIRSLVYDFGKALNSGAYLSSLRRTKIGEYDVADAFQIEELIQFIQSSDQVHESI